MICKKGDEFCLELFALSFLVLMFGEFYEYAHYN